MKAVHYQWRTPRLYGRSSSLEEWKSARQRSVLARKAAETQGKGTALPRKVAGTQGKGNALIHESSGNTRQRRCLRHEGSGSSGNTRKGTALPRVLSTRSGERSTATTHLGVFSARWPSPTREHVILKQVVCTVHTLDPLPPPITVYNQYTHRCLGDLGIWTHSIRLEQIGAQRCRRWLSRHLKASDSAPVYRPVPQPKSIALLAASCR